MSEWRRDFLFAFADVLIAYDFIIGAATFAVGHICFVVAYCFLQKFSIRDLIPSGILFLGALAFCCSARCFNLKRLCSGSCVLLMP